jgi:hypothetical protein
MAATVWALTAARRVVLVFRCIRTEATDQCPTLVRLDGMSERREPDPVAIPVHRHAEDAPRFFILPGTRTHPAANHSEDLVRFLVGT